jgi:5-(carboxyamino)imidazole ribonucleotide synthase
VIGPGRTVGILGGGQLGRMFAIAARRMGYRVHSFDPTCDCPAGQVADIEITAEYDDLAAARRFAEGVDVVTFEFENIPPETLFAIAGARPVHPSPEVLDTCRHRLREKAFLARHGFPIARHRPVRSEAELKAALGELGMPAILKTADFGYDGKGQTWIARPEEISVAWAHLGRPIGVLEAVVPFVRELSVVCARTAAGEILCFDPVENVHVRHILDVTTAPGGFSSVVVRQAVELARAIAEALQLVGVLAVELFELADGGLVVNELAPRPHNSGHHTVDACVTSQFEQQLRTVCGLPLGSTQLLRPAAMVNLLGDLWAAGAPNWEGALAFPDVKLHLYGKAEARPGRKMGHLTALAETAAQARNLALAARAAISLRG